MFRVKRKRKSNELYCDHCDEILSKSAYWRHRKVYFNPTTCEWTKKSASLNQCEQGTSSTINQDTKNFPGFSSDEETIQATESEECIEPNGYLQPDTGNQSTEKDDDEISSTSSSKSDIEDLSSSDTEAEHEIWHDKEEELLQDMNEDTPLPEPRQKESTSRAITSLLQWFVYFLLFWQTTCKISDNGLEWLLRFMFQFLHLLGVTTNNEHLIEIAVMVPSSLYLLRKFVTLDRDNFTKYAVCPECLKLYNLDSCTVRIGERVESKTCTNKPFISQRKAECGAVLAKKVTTEKNGTVFYPFKVYCYNSIINQLESILKRPGMSDLCEKWRNRKVKTGTMADIYDGQVWKDFQKVNGKDFLKSNNNIGLAINVDWFQPYKRRKDRSIGIIYFVMLNLPREERYKWQNVIVAGIIPELKKEPKSLNSFLNPLVEELNSLWKGVRIKTSKSRMPLIHRAALILVSSDIPASRKLCGFKGHSAHRGCSKCFKYFPGSFTERTDYSGFDVQSWPPRDMKTHRINADHVKDAPTKGKQEELAKKHGVYYSSLLKLQYFDAIRLTVIDPMHNLFLGTAKHIFKIWIEKDILNKKRMTELEKRILECDVHTGFGRLPNKISCNHGCYTASQWKSWTLIYSIYCLKDIIPEEHFKCWQTFVLACQYMSRHVISEVDIVRADGLFIKFCKKVEQLYGKETVTPNMHLHCHLKQCVTDYGPLHAFWCFSFERFNGILGSTKMNGRSIEIQLMRKLIVSRFTWNTTMPTEFQETFLPFFQDSSSDMHMQFNDINATYFSTSCSSHNLSNVNWADLSLVVLPKSFQHFTFDKDDLQLLLQCYKQILPNDDNLTLHSLARIARKYSFVLLGSEKFGSNKDKKSARSARVMAHWSDDNSTINPSSQLRPGEVKFYFLHSLLIDGKTRQFAFACIKWHSKDEEFDMYGNPAKVWRLKEFENAGPAVFMPVQRITCTFAACFIKSKNIDKLVVTPIPRLFN